MKTLTRTVQYNLHADFYTQELRLQGLGVPKILFYDFKVAITF